MESNKKYTLDKDGFYLMSERVPDEYDLVVFKDDQGRTASGWLQGKKPQGLKVDYLTNIIKWKRYTHL